MNLANNIDQFAGRGALEQVGLRPFGEGSPNLVIARETTDDDKTRVRKLGADGDHYLYAAYVRKPDIHENDIRLVLTKILNRLASGGTVGHQQHVRLSVYDAGNSEAPQGMVVNVQNRDLVAHTSPIYCLLRLKAYF